MVPVLAVPAQHQHHHPENDVYDSACHDYETCIDELSTDFFLLEIRPTKIETH